MTCKEALKKFVDDYQGVMYLNYYATTGIFKLKIIVMDEKGESLKYTKMAASEDLVYEHMYDFIFNRMRRTNSPLTEVNGTSPLTEVNGTAVNFSNTYDK